MYTCELKSKIDKIIKGFSHLYYKIKRGNQLMTAIVEVLDQRILQHLCNLENNINIDNASGFWLDIIGNRYGFPRPLLVKSGEVLIYDKEPFDKVPYGSKAQFLTLNDPTYRTFLKIHAMKLISRHSYKDIKVIMDTVFGVGNWNYYDNCDMTVKYTIAGNPSYLKTVELVDILPRQQTVSVTLERKTDAFALILDRDPFDKLPME